MSITQVSVKQEDHSYRSEPIGVEAANVDIDETHTLANKAIEWDNKVDKVNGKGLSSNDFTNNEKIKLSGLTNYDDTELNSRVTDIEDLIPDNADSENKLVTAADIAEKADGRKFIGTHEGWDALSPEEQDPITEIIYTDDNGGSNTGSGSSYTPSTSSYRLPIASSTVLGGVKIGENLTIDKKGVLSATGGGNGTTNYEELSNKPKIGGVTLTGDKSLSDLGIQGKEQGKGLSTNDFTDADKTKLDNLSNYDDAELSGRLSSIEEKLPSNASAENKLATLADIPSGGTGEGTGTTNYNDLTNKPQIAGIALSGNKTLADLGIQPSEQGKGLSDNNYTDAEKTKLNGLSNYDDTALATRVDNIEELVPASASNSNKLATIADIPSGSEGTTDYDDLTNKPQIEGIELTGNKSLSDLGIQPSVQGKGLSTEDYTTEEKTKLNSLSNYDDSAIDNRLNDIEEVIPTSATSSNPLATLADIPSNVSGGNNVATNYATLTNKPQIAGVELTGNKTLANLGIQPAEEGKGLSTNDYTNAEKEKLAELTNYDDTELVNSLNNKVDKIEGKTLSTNDYTNDEKTKLAGLSNYDDTILAGKIADIEGIIPSTASEDNKLATMADISSGSGDTVDYNNLLTLVNYDSDQSPYNIEIGETYTLGGGAKTNQNNSIQVKCLSVDNETAIMQTYGVTASTWPGSEDLTESYNNYFGELSSAISGVKLPTGTTQDNIEPLGAYEILKTVANNRSSFGADYSYAWLGTPSSSSGAYSVHSGGVVNSDITGIRVVCAPYFILNLSKVLINDGVIELNPSYKDAEFADLVTKIETKLNNRYTKSEVNKLIDNTSSIPEGGTAGQVLTKKSDVDGDVEWKEFETGSNQIFNESDFNVTEEGEVSLKPDQRTWIGTRAEWDALSIEEKEKYGGIINITDDPNELDNKVDKIDGKGLSTNDYTDEEKTKLAGIEPEAEANIIESISVNGIQQTITSKNVDITVGEGGSGTPIATTSVAGKVKPDGTTIAVDENGVISAIGAISEGSSISNIKRGAFYFPDGISNGFCDAEVTFDSPMPSVNYEILFYLTNIKSMRANTPLFIKSKTVNGFTVSFYNQGEVTNNNSGEYTVFTIGSGGGGSYSIITPSEIDRLWGSSLDNGDLVVYDDIADGDSEEY